jgi:competence protein ComEC
MPFDVPWRIAHAVLEPLMAMLGGMAELPAAAWAQHEPPAWTVVAAILGTLLALAPKGMPGRTLGVSGCLPLFLVLPAAPERGAFRLTALDVGQGTAVVVQTHTHSLVYDTGPRWHDAADAGSRIVAPFLRASGVRAVDALVVSHKDLDHSGGAMSVLAAVPVGFVLSSLPDDSPVLARQSRRGLALRCQGGQSWHWDGVRFDVLHPQAPHYNEPLRKSNDLSCVLRISGPGGSALLAGDIEAISERDLIANGEKLAADVLVVPHHGSRTSSTAAFVEGVAPRHAVFTVGHRNRFGHPRADVVARYATAGSAVHRTDVGGALRFDFVPPGPGPPHAWRSANARYWRTTPAPP